MWQILQTSSHWHTIGFQTAGWSRLRLVDKIGVLTRRMGSGSKALNTIEVLARRVEFASCLDTIGVLARRVEIASGLDTIGVLARRVETIPSTQSGF